MPFAELAGASVKLPPFGLIAVDVIPTFRNNRLSIVKGELIADVTGPTALVALKIAACPAPGGVAAVVPAELRPDSDHGRDPGRDPGYAAEGEVGAFDMRRPRRP